MTIERNSEALGFASEDSEFDLDVRIVESGPVTADLMAKTDNGCGQTCESACPATGC